MFTVQFDKNVYDKNIAWRSEHLSLTPKFCVLWNASLLYLRTYKKCNLRKFAAYENFTFAVKHLVTRRDNATASH